MKMPCSVSRKLKVKASSGRVRAHPGELVGAQVDAGLEMFGEALADLAS